MLRKQRGRKDFAMIRGFTFSEPSELQQNKTVIRSFAPFPPTQVELFSIKVLFGKPRQNKPASSQLNMFRRGS